MATPTRTAGKAATKAVKKPAVKAAAPRKLVRRSTVKDDGIKSLLGRAERVKVTQLKVHPKNPREGDIDEIAESLDESGQYRRLVVQESTMTILAGNHTYLAARQLGWRFIDVEIINVDDDEAETIMLADNATGQRGGFNESLLAEILSKRKSVRGTGYKKEEVEELVARHRARITETVEEVERRNALEAEAIAAAKDSSKFDRVPLGEEAAVSGREDDDDMEDDEEDIRPGGLEKADDTLSGAFELKEDLAFTDKDAVGVWKIPRIRTDMLMTWEELPDNLLAWAGSATKDWPEDDVWWLYNFGIDSTSGMKDPSKMILSFYAFDENFENWWWYVKKYTTKALNTGIKYAVMPDFSMHTPGEESRVLSLWSLYRNRYLARYFQEAGIKVIPNVTWATKDEDFLTRHILPTLPKGMSLLALQVQTVDKKNESHSDYVRQLQLVLDTLKPESLLLYYGKQGKEIFDNGEVKFSGNIKWVASRMHALSAQASKRTKKKTF